MRRVSMGLHVTGCICYQPFQAMRHAVRHCGRFGHLSRCSIAAPDCAAMPHHRSGRIQAVARAALQARDVYARYRPASPSGDRPLRGNRTGGTDRAGSGCASNAGLGRADRTRRRQDGGRAASRQPLCWADKPSLRDPQGTRGQCADITRWSEPPGRRCHTAPDTEPSGKIRWRAQPKIDLDHGASVPQTVTTECRTVGSPRA